MISLPYPGLRPFRPDESHIYFGRDEQTDELLERLSHSRFLAVVGPSGCGKSSLVNTGVIASLQMGILASTGSHWQVARMQPRGHPMANLAQALVQSQLVTPIGGEGADASDKAAFTRWVRGALERGPYGLRDILERHPPPHKANILLVVDQFE